MNIILVVSDTLRQDHLPCYGNERIIAPHIANFAQESVVFDNCHAASFPTAPARADILSGRYTFTYRDWGPLRKEETSIVEVLNNAGYMTCGIADQPFLIRNGYDYDRGFQQFIWFRGQRQGPDREDVVKQWRCEEDRFAPATFKAALEWLERNHREQFFLYIDTWDPHEPWDPPHHYVRPYYPDYRGEDVYPCYWDWEDHGVTRKELEIGHACYCGEITMVDRWFGMLVDRLKSLELYDETIVILTSDHGIYFGEHGIFGKARFRWPDNTIPVAEAMVRYRLGALSHRSPLHNEISKVPLLMHIPGIHEGRVELLATLPDLMPTMLDMVGVPAPVTVQARSLFPLVTGKSDRVNDLVVTSHSLAAQHGGLTKIVDDNARLIMELSPSTIHTEEWDLLYAVKGEPVELYRAKEDPQHQNNLADDEPAVVEEIHGRYVAWLESVKTPEQFLAPRREL